MRSYRKSQRLPDKNDKADALALACYGWQHLKEPEFFLRFAPVPALKLRRCCLQLNHLNRLQTPIVNCTRQYLAHEFPEAAKIKSRARTDKSDVLALWGWLSGDRPSPYYDRLWSKSVAQDFGLNISDFTRSQAGRICELERYQQLIECEIKDLISQENFTVYNSVFDSFGFGLRTRALFLAHIYPFTDFLSEINQPVIEYGESDKGRPTNRDRAHYVLLNCV